MAKKNYEIMLVFSVKDGEDAAKELFEKFKALVEKHDGVINDVDEWGKRKLAYEIKHKTHGYYVIFYYKAEASVVAELENIFKLDENVLRWITLVDYPMSEIVYDKNLSQTEDVTPIDAEEGDAE